MQPTHRIRLAWATALIVWLVSAAADGQPRPRKVRTSHITGEPIAKSLKPDDEIVELAPLGEGAAHLWQPPRALFESAMRQGDSSVVRVDVTGVSGVLTDEGSFVKTQFVGRIGARSG